MPTLADLQDILASVETFMASKAYGQVQTSIAVDLANHEASLLATAPDTAESIAFLNRLHGKREATLDWQKFFVGLRDTLKAEIKQLQLDSETESRNVSEEITE